MHIQDVLYNGQPQAAAHLGPLVLLVHLVVALPDVLELVLRDALAGVGDRHPHLALFHGLAQGDGLILAGVRDGVVHQVIHHLGNLQLVGVHPHILLEIEGKAVVRQLVIPVQHAPYAFCEVETGFLQGEHPGLQLGEIQQVVDQAGQALCLVDDDLHIFRGVLSGQVPHHLAIALNHGQRRAQVVRDVGQQVPPQALHLRELLGGVVQGAGQFPHLPGAPLLKADGVIPPAQHLGALVHGCQGAGNPPGDEQGQRHAQRRRHRRQGGHLHQQGLTDRIHRGNLTLQHHHAVEPRGRTANGDIQHHLVAGAVLVYKGRAHHLQPAASVQVHIVKQVRQPQPGLGEVVQVALLPAGLPAGEHLPHFIRDHYADARVQAQLLHLLVQVLRIQVALDHFGSGLHFRCLHRAVEGFQQHNLEQPQQGPHHQDQHAKTAEDLPPQAHGAPFSSRHFSSPRTGSPRPAG